MKEAEVSKDGPHKHDNDAETAVCCLKCFFVGFQNFPGQKFVLNEVG